LPRLLIPNLARSQKATSGFGTSTTAIVSVDGNMSELTQTLRDAPMTPAVTGAPATVAAGGSKHRKGTIPLPAPALSTGDRMEGSFNLMEYVKPCEGMDKNQTVVNSIQKCCTLMCSADLPKTSELKSLATKAKKFAITKLEGLLDILLDCVAAENFEQYTQTKQQLMDLGLVGWNCPASWDLPIKDKILIKAVAGMKQSIPSLSPGCLEFCQSIEDQSHRFQVVLKLLTGLLLGKCSDDEMTVSWQLH
jgi:hypothetical protein